MRRPFAAVAIATATLIAGAAVGTTSGAAQAGTEGDDRVRITFLVNGCNGCTLGLGQLHADPEGGPPYTWGASTKVRHGRAVFTVPAENTYGTSIAIRAPWQKGFVHGGFYVATRYNGFDSGDQVSSQQASRARRGTYCWAGTDEDQTIRIQVDRFTFDAVGTDDPGVGPRAYASPSLPTGTATLGRTWRGTFVSTYPACPAS